MEADSVAMEEHHLLEENLDEQVVAHNEISQLRHQLERQ